MTLPVKLALILLLGVSGCGTNKSHKDKGASGSNNLDKGNKDGDKDSGVPSSLASLNYLKVSNSTALSPDFDPSVGKYSVTVAGSIKSVEISATPSVEDASIQILMNGRESSSPYPVNVGENLVTINVTAPDKVNTAVYYITITRQVEPRSDATLASLSANNADLIPEFKPAVTAYAVSIASDVESIEVTPVTNQRDSLLDIQKRHSEV